MSETTDWVVRRTDCRADETCVACRMEMGDTHLPTCLVPLLTDEARGLDSGSDSERQP